MEYSKLESVEYLNSTLNIEPYFDSFAIYSYKLPEIIESNEVIAPMYCSRFILFSINLIEAMFKGEEEPKNNLYIVGILLLFIY